MIINPWKKINWFCVEWKGGRCDFGVDEHLMDEKQIKQLKAKRREWDKRVGNWWIFLIIFLGCLWMWWFVWCRLIVLEKLMVLFCESYVKEANEPPLSLRSSWWVLTMVGLMICSSGWSSKNGHIMEKIKIQVVEELKYLNCL
jgi:hypothetical protein